MSKISAEQADYQAGVQDGQRYHGDGHGELVQRYQRGSGSYREGFRASAQYPRSLDPDFAS